MNKKPLAIENSYGGRKRAYRDNPNEILHDIDTILHVPRNVFLQGYIGDDPILRVDADNHPESIRQFLIELAGYGLLDKETVKAQIENITDVPMKDGAYHIVGMGRCEGFKESKEFFVFGDSMTYGLSPNKEHLERIASHAPGWTFIEGNPARRL